MYCLFMKIIKRTRVRNYFDVFWVIVTDYNKNEYQIYGLADDFPHAIQMIEEQGKLDLKTEVKIVELVPYWEPNYKRMSGKV